MLILLAEDDPKISKLILTLLRGDGYQIDHASDGNSALAYTETNIYDLIILDWMMPGKSGVEVAAELRRRNFTGGILMLTAKDTLKDKVSGFEAGVDDYLVKPFDYEELQMRILALLRRSRQGYKKDELKAGPLLIDRGQKRVFRDGESVGLSKREYQLLLVLAENMGRTIPRGNLIDQVWGLDAEVTPNNLDAYIRLLRKKIETRTYKPIVNVRGIGYRMEA